MIQTVVDLMNSPRWEGETAEPLTKDEKTRAEKLADRLTDQVESEVGKAANIEDPWLRLRRLDALAQKAALLHDAAVEERDGAIKEMIDNFEGTRGERAALKEKIGKMLWLSAKKISQIAVRDRLRGNREDGSLSHRQRIARQFTHNEEKDGVPISGPKWLAKVFFEDHLTMAEIAEMAGCSEQTVGRWLNEHFTGHPEYDTREKDPETGELGPFRIAADYLRLRADDEGADAA